MPPERVGPAEEATVSTEIDGRISLFNPATDRVMMLNETASDVWRLSDGDHDMEHLVELLSRAYGVDVDSIRDEVRGVVALLAEEGFLPPIGE